MDKKNFEKDINVPSERRIMDDYNAKDCEQCNSDSVCCYCKNIACYQLEETIDGLLKIQYQLADNNKKLHQCLTEIKEIAEDLIIITDEYDNCYHKDECDKCLLGIDGNCQYIKVEQILQKISEVE